MKHFLNLLQLRRSFIAKLCSRVGVGLLSGAGVGMLFFALYAVSTEIEPLDWGYYFKLFGTLGCAVGLVVGAVWSLFGESSG